MRFKMIMKLAVIMAALVVLSTVILILLTILTNTISAHQPDAVWWSTPLIASIVIVVIAVVLWQRSTDATEIRNEFLNVVTHKFRTPLTHIKWAAENLDNSKLDADQRTEVGYIISSNTKLVELTNLLVNAAGSKNAFDYHFVKSDLSALLSKVVSSSRSIFEAKTISWISDITPGLIADIDLIRVKFVLQTMIENAVHYSNEPVVVHISLRRNGKLLHCSITDNGIGISRSEMPNLFKKFWRSHEASLADNDGLGIGLFIAKDIIERHGGHIWGTSKGAGTGSTFEFTLKEAR